MVLLLCIKTNVVAVLIVKSLNDLKKLSGDLEQAATK